MFDSYANARPATTRLMDMMDEGMIDARTVADMALMWLHEQSVAEMMRSNDILEENLEEYETEELLDDGQPDEAQEWESFDPDC
jgi:hypothetical protein